MGSGEVDEEEEEDVEGLLLLLWDFHGIVVVFDPVPPLLFMLLGVLPPVDMDVEADKGWTVPELELGKGPV